MKTALLTPEEVRTRGIDALQRELGTDGMLKFIQNFSHGKGDYTKERHRWLDQLTVDDIIRDVCVLRRHRKQANGVAAR